LHLTKYLREYRYKDESVIYVDYLVSMKPTKYIMKVVPSICQQYVFYFICETFGLLKYEYEEAYRGF